MNQVLVIAAGDTPRPPGNPFAFQLAFALHQRRSGSVLYCDAENTAAVRKGTSFPTCLRTARPLKARDSPIGVARVLAATRVLLSYCDPPACRPIVVLIGSPFEQLRVLWALVTAGLRPCVLVILHVGAADVPFRPETSDLFHLADLIVAESAFGARAVQRCCKETLTSLRRRIAIIPPPVEGGAGQANDPSQRQAVRKNTFGVLPDQLLVVCRAGHPADHRAFLAMQIFRTFAEGQYWTCARCHRITAFNSDESLRPLPASTCSFCLATDGRRGQGWPTARLFVSGGTSRSSDTAIEPDSWDLRSVRRALGLEARVFVEGDDGIPEADGIETVFERVSAADINLLPHDLADVEPALLAGCAMGVPAIATRFGATAEVFGSQVRLVAPCALLLTSEGHWRATMDAGAAVAELLALAHNAGERTALGASARDSMRALSWDNVANRWFDQIDRLCSSMESACADF